MLDQTQREAIRQALAQGPPWADLLLQRPQEDHELDTGLQAFIEQLRAIAGDALALEEGDDGPGLVLRREGAGTIRYQALPTGPELPPFLAALTGPTEELQAPPQAAELTVFIAEACPHCPRAVGVAIRLALANPQVQALVIDAQRFPELAAEQGVRSVPTTVIDGELAITGVKPLEEILQALRERGAPEHHQRRKKALLQGERLDEATALLTTPAGAAAFCALWAQSELSDRLGLMLLAEEALEDDEDALDGLVDGLLPALGAASASLRGDTADLLGQIALPAAQPALQGLLQDDNDDVVELAEEALEAIQERSQA